MKVSRLDDSYYIISKSENTQLHHNTMNVNDLTSLQSP